MGANTEVKITPAMQREMETLLAIKGAARFRRSDLSERLYTLTKPRSRPKADALADAVIKAAARAGVIVREGHQHWVRASQHRVLKSGREVVELDDTIELPLKTHCPEKWLSIDLETGDIWIGTQGGWKRAPAAVVAELRALIDSAA